MTEILFRHIEQKVMLSERDKATIAPFFTAKKLRRKQYLLQAGDTCKYLSFVVNGLIRTYNVDEKGDEHMSIFGWEGWWLSDFNSFLSGDPAVFNIDALEDSELLMITKADYEKLTLEAPIMDRYFRILFQNSLVTKERRLMSSITHTAEEKYIELVDSSPEMINKIPQNMIASYLGIAPETLSRIKRNLANKR